MLSGKRRDDLRDQAIILRTEGLSYPMIESRLNVARATLSGWFKNLKIPQSAQERILRRKRLALERQRKKAVLKLRAKKDKERQEIIDSVSRDYSEYKLDIKINELLLAMLYLGEGFKTTRAHIGLANSNPEIAKIFVKFLRDIYKVEDSRLRCFLHLRLDQDSEIEKKFWSQQLDIPKLYFRKAEFDNRAKTKTWSWYHGVCVIYCYDARIEKRLVFLQKLVINKILGD